MIIISRTDYGGSLRVQSAILMIFICPAYGMSLKAVVSDCQNPIFVDDEGEMPVAHILQNTTVKQNTVGNINVS